MSIQSVHHPVTIDTMQQANEVKAQIESKLTNIAASILQISQQTPTTQTIQTSMQLVQKQEESIAQALQIIHGSVPSSSLPIRIKEGIVAQLCALNEKAKSSQQEIKKAKTQLLTKYMRHAVTVMRDVNSKGSNTLSKDDLRKLEPFFNKEITEGLFDEIRELLQTISFSASEYAGLERDQIHQNLVQRAREGNDDINLLLSVIEFKELYVANIDRYLRATNEKNSLEPYLAKLKVEEEHSLVAKFFEGIFMKKRGIGTVMLLSLALGFSAVTMPPTMKALKVYTASNAIASAFMLPSMVYCGYQLFSNASSIHTINSRMKDIKRIQSNGEFYANEGQELIDQANLHRKSGEMNEALEMQKRGNQLLSMGVEIREKAKHANETLKHKKGMLKGKMALHTMMGLSGGLMGSSMSKEVLQALAGVQFSSTAVSALHFLGIAGGVLNIGVGVLGSAMYISEIKKTKSRISNAAEQLGRAVTLNHKYPNSPLLQTLTKLEDKNLTLEVKKENIALRNHYISLASMLFLTVAGCIMIGMFIGAGNALSAVLIITLALMFLSIVTSAGHMYYRHRLHQSLEASHKELARGAKQMYESLILQIQTSKEGKELKEAFSYLGLADADFKAFRLNPKAFLEHRYEHLLEGTNG